MILPAALRYQGELAGVAANLQAIGHTADTSILDALLASTAALTGAIKALDGKLAEHGGDDAHSEAGHCCDVLVPAMAVVRAACSELEHLVADDLWPLPTYQEMLFIL